MLLSFLTFAAEPTTVFHGRSLHMLNGVRALLLRGSAKLIAPPLLTDDGEASPIIEPQPLAAPRLLIGRYRFLFVRFPLM